MVNNVSASLGKDQRLSIEDVDPAKNKPIPLFFGLGRSGKSKHKIEGVDAALKLSKLSGRSSWFFWTLVGLRDHESNLSDIRLHRFKGHLTETEMGRIPRAYAELRDAGLVVRYSKGIYLINPKVVLPWFSNFEAIWDKWIATRKKHGLLS
jgi:hypothetical protein